MTASPATTGWRARFEENLKYPNQIDARMHPNRSRLRLAAFLLDFRPEERQAIDFQGFVLHIGSQNGAIARRTIGLCPVL
jgi:hypothetical protein